MPEFTHVGPKNHVSDESQDRANPFAAGRGDKSVMRPDYIGHLLELTVLTVEEVMLST